MKLLFITIIQLLATVALPQKSKTFFVEYFHKQESPILLPNDGKTNFIVTYPDSNNKQIIDTVAGSLSFDSFKFETLVFMIANHDSSKTFFSTVKTASDNVNISINTPDTLFYSRKGTWTKVSSGEFESIASLSISVVETKEKKNILGYECIKYVSLDAETDIVFWASKQLPCTILPYTGLKQFKYGILEVEDLKNKSHTKATKIRTL